MRWLLCCAPACTLLRPLDELSSEPTDPVMQSEAAGAANQAAPNALDGVTSGGTTFELDGMAVGLDPGGEHDSDSGDAGAVRDDSNAGAGSVGGGGGTDSVAGAGGAGTGGEGAHWQGGAGGHGGAAGGASGRGGGPPDDVVSGGGAAGYDGDDRRDPESVDAGALCTSDGQCLEGRCLEAGGGCQPCPPEMALARFDDGTAFCIDRLEVTQRQYQDFLDGVVDRPDIAARPVCGDNASLQPGIEGGCSEAFQPAITPDLPISCVDACDALAYCLWAGKRLCGAKNGLPLPPALVGDIGLDEWQLSCNDGSSRLYPYGGSYVSDACTVASESVASVGSQQACATEGGVFDLSGNVAEWTDCCRSIDGILRCAARGGSYLHQNPLGVACSAAPTDGVDPQFAPPYLSQQPHLGIRCCAD
jgi:formylglycine-generating enzyme